VTRVARRPRGWRTLLLLLGLLLLVAALVLAFVVAFRSDGARRAAEASSRDAFASAERANREAELARKAARDAREQAADARRWTMRAERAGRDRKPVAPAPSAQPAATPVPSRPPAPRPTRSPVAVTTPPSSFPPVPAGGRENEACRQALIFERTAATDWVARQAAYSAANSGLAVNEHCNQPWHDVNEAYLLAMRAPAAYALNVGNWRDDLDRSDGLLARCAERIEAGRTWVAQDCRTQSRFNRTVRSEIERQIAARRK
jgi:hypothetical protein